MKRIAVIFAFLLVVLGAVMVAGYLAFGADPSDPQKPRIAAPVVSEPDSAPATRDATTRETQPPGDRPDEPGDPNVPDQTDSPDESLNDTGHAAESDDGRPDDGEVEAPQEPVRAAITIAGRVLDDEGRPVHAATVTLYYTPTGGRGDVPLQKLPVARTDADGYYRGEATLTFPGEDAPLSVTLQAQKEEGLHSDEVTREFKPGSVHGNLDMVIPSGSALTGRVVDLRYQPVAGAIVRAQWTDGQKLGSTLTARADEQGNFRVEGMRTGTYVVRVSAAGYQPDADAPEVEMDAAVDQEMKGDLVLKPVTGLRLQLTSNAGQPAGDFTVTFYNSEGQATPAKARADNKGNALISPAPEDAIEMEIEMSGYEKSERLAVFIIKDDHADLGIVNLTSHATDGD